jgi:hypothetical protein
LREDPYLHDERLRDLVRRVKRVLSGEADRTGHKFNLCTLEVFPKSHARKTLLIWRVLTVGRR